MTLDEARRHIGDEVMFRGGASSEDERGVITSVGEQFVFVRYARSQTRTATLARNLVLVARRVCQIPACGCDGRWHS